MEDFLKDVQPERVLPLLYTKSEDFWRHAGERRMLALFHAMAKGVPAYKDFLKKHAVRVQSVVSFPDLDNVPPVTKTNYLRQYPLEALTWGGTLKDKASVFTATSGSTGASFYFPRDLVLDTQSSIFHEIFLDTVSENKKSSTLVVDCFGMGIWIGGLITYQAFRMIALRGYPLTVITPGSNKKEALEAIAHIGKQFDQIILCGYPPFLKDLLDEGLRQGIVWSALNIKLLGAAEAFGEPFRSYLAEKAGIKNPGRDTANIYGSADLGTMAQETPVSIVLRQRALLKRPFFEKLFGLISKVPTFAQFNPLFTNFQAHEGGILCSGYNTLPLMRYDIGDHGGVLSFGEVIALSKEHDIRIPKRVKPIEWPFVYVYERSDFSTKLCGAIIYPEHIRDALVTPAVSGLVTGKFSLVTTHDKEQNQYLEINLELKPDKKESKGLHARVHALIKDHLLEKNAEYAYLHSLMPGRVEPVLVFWKYEDPLHFHPGGKQKWVKK